MPKLKTKIEERIRELLPELKKHLSSSTRVFGEYVFPEIHLEHILMAIEKVDSGNQVRVFTNGFTNGMFFGDIGDMSGHLVKYDLSKDFNHQEESVYNDIWNIITPQ